jgi:hypothetical protein
MSTPPLKADPDALPVNETGAKPFAELLLTESE